MNDTTNTSDSKQLNVTEQRQAQADMFNRLYAFVLSIQELVESDKASGSLKALTQQMERLPDGFLDDAQWPGRKLLISVVEARLWRRISKEFAQSLAAIKPDHPQGRAVWQQTCHAIAGVLAEHDPDLSRQDVLNSWQSILGDIPND